MNKIFFCTYFINHKKYSMFNNLFLLFFFYKFFIKNRFLYKNVFFSFAPTSSSAAHDDGETTEMKM